MMRSKGASDKLWEESLDGRSVAVALAPQTRPARFICKVTVHLVISLCVGAGVDVQWGAVVLYFRVMFVCLAVTLSVRNASLFRISLRDFCRRLATCEVDIRNEVHVL